ncbi:MAG: hypothetical protein AAGG09_12165 [Pseudomonadota bacterium]
MKAKIVAGLALSASLSACNTEGGASQNAAGPAIGGSGFIVPDVQNAVRAGVDACAAGTVSQLPAKGFKKTFQGHRADIRNPGLRATVSVMERRSECVITISPATFRDRSAIAALTNDTLDGIDANNRAVLRVGAMNFASFIEIGIRT